MTISSATKCSQSCGGAAALQWRKWSSQGTCEKCRPSSSVLAALQTPNWCVMPSVKCSRPEFESRAFIPPDMNPVNVRLYVNFPNYILPMWKVSIHKPCCHSEVQYRAAPTLNWFTVCEDEWRLQEGLVVVYIEDTRISPYIVHFPLKVSLLCVSAKEHFLNSIIQSFSHLLVSLNSGKAFLAACGQFGHLWNFIPSHTAPRFIPWSMEDWNC